MTKPDLTGVLTVAAEVVSIGKEVEGLAAKVAEKETGNEPDGLVPNALSRLAEVTQKLGECVQTLAGELEKKP